MVPILPVALLALVPLAEGLFSKSRLRKIYFLVLNGLLLLATLFSTPQRNALELVRYLNERPDISVLYDYEGSVVPYLSAFLKSPVRYIRLEENNRELWHPENCASISAVRWDWAERMLTEDRSLRPQPSSHRPGPKPSSSDSTCSEMPGEGPSCSTSGPNVCGDARALIH
ncbi:MAG: hypothetical protein R3B54_14105 [Bdellovibrionota bacterium]